MSKFIFPAVIACVFCALIGVYSVSLGNSGKSLLVAAPKSEGVLDTPIDALEEINENKFMLTYASYSQSAAKAYGKNAEVMLVGVNYRYPYALGYGVVSGGFFTKEAQKHGSRSAVLNVKAAFDIFGSCGVVGKEIALNGVKYMVAGVIDDQEEESAHVFLPAAELNKTLSEIICPLDEGRGISAEYVKSELKYIGITDDRFDFTDSTLIRTLLKNNIVCACCVLALILICTLLKRLYGYINKTLSVMKKELESVYLKGFIFENRGLCVKSAAAAAGVAACLVIILYILSVLLEIYLLWADSYEAVSVNGFFTASNVLLVIFIVFCALFPVIQNVLNGFHNAEPRVKE